MLNFKCKSCGEIKEMNQKYESTPISKTGLSNCKSCLIEQVRFNYIQKKLKMSPQNYMQCNDCDFVFHYIKKGANKVFGKEEIRKECPRCKSLDIEDVIGG